MRILTTTDEISGTIYYISITFHTQNQDQVMVPIKLTAIDCFTDINPFQEASEIVYTLMGFSGSDRNDGILTEYYSLPENFDIFTLELGHVLALLHLTMDLDKKYEGLFSSQLKNYFDDLITKINQLKTSIENKEIKKFLLSSEIENLFDRLPMPYTDGHPLKILKDKFLFKDYK